MPNELDALNVAAVQYIRVSAKTLVDGVFGPAPLLAAMRKQAKVRRDADIAERMVAFGVSRSVATAAVDVAAAFCADGVPGGRNISESFIFANCDDL